VIPTEPRTSTEKPPRSILIRFIVGAMWLSILVTLLGAWLGFTFDRGHDSPQYGYWELAWMVGYVFITAIYVGASEQFGLLKWMFNDDED
jgi:hypothetical protein